MLNQLVLVGRYSGYTKNSGDGNFISLKVPRSYKNAEGEYETDTLYVKVSDNIFDNFKEYVKKGDLIGIKGRVESEFCETNGTKLHKTILVCDKLTFLSSNPNAQKVEDDMNEED